MTGYGTVCGQRMIEVGIMSAPEIAFELTGDGHGVRKVFFRDGKILYDGILHDELVFSPASSEKKSQDSPDHVFAEPSFILYGVTIGVDFHWQRKQDQTFAGTLKFIVEGDRITAVNVIGIEDYLVSVISSEMKASASLDLLKAHAVISRSWVMSQVEKRQSAASGRKAVTDLPSGQENIIIRWWDHEDHKAFDVCADDHCQRYQGLTNALGENVRKAVSGTWGLVLRYDGKLCDARFSKCCGGTMERFSTCWEDIDYPYLQPLPDVPEGGGRCFCDTDDESVLSQILNDYDLETRDFFRWETRYTRPEVSDLVRRKSGVDLGEIRSLEPLERGESGRISRLKIEGTAGTAVFGKELMIRRILSESHLKSSAFDVEWQGDILTLKGRGWGHGAGLCQIGAAVMAHQGYDYLQILKHYYPGAAVEP